MTAPSGHAALANGREWTSYPPGYCLKWVRAECWKIGGLYASAIDAWHGAVVRHKGDRTPPVGAPMFYEGGQYGHVVVAADGDQRGTDSPTTGRVSEQAVSWPETNWGFTYLGWTEDLNAVDLPLDEEEDMPLTDADLAKIRDVVVDVMNGQKAAYADAVMFHDVDDREPPTNTRAALRLSADHARGHPTSE